MIGISIREDAYQAIVESFPPGHRLFPPQQPSAETYRIWIPKTAANLLFGARQTGEDISDTIIRVAAAWAEIKACEQ